MTLLTSGTSEWKRRGARWRKSKIGWMVKYRQQENHLSETAGDSVKVTVIVLMPWQQSASKRSSTLAPLGLFLSSRSQPMIGAR